MLEVVLSKIFCAADRDYNRRNTQSLAEFSRAPSPTRTTSMAHVVAEYRPAAA